MPVNPTPAEGVVVPLEATSEMMDAMFDAARQRERHMDGGVGYVQLRAAWEAALAARPAAPTQSAAQTGEEERLRAALERIASEDEPEIGNGNTNDLLARQFWTIATEALSQPEPSQ